MKLSCPHCQGKVHEPPACWQFAMPWQCSSCGGMYGIGNRGTFAIRPNFEPLCPLLGYDIAQRWCFYAGLDHHYIYALCYGSGLPFYIGRGQKLRALAHENECRRGKVKRRTEKHDVIDWLAIHQEPVWYHFLAYSDDAAMIDDAESFYIHRYGLRSMGGILTNEVQPELDDLYYPFVPDDWPYDHSEIRDFGQKIGKWSHSVRILRHPDHFLAPEPSSVALVTGAVERCAACGELYQYFRDQREKKCICPSCGHFVFPATSAILSYRSN